LLTPLSQQELAKRMDDKMILYVVRDEDLDILGIYEDAWDAEERTNELEAEGWQDITITDYKLNLDVELYLDTNVVEFGQKT
jgi:hypothetical protein